MIVCAWEWLRCRVLSVSYRYRSEGDFKLRVEEQPITHAFMSDPTTLTTAVCTAVCFFSLSLSHSAACATVSASPGSRLSRLSGSYTVSLGPVRELYCCALSETRTGA